MRMHVTMRPDGAHLYVEARGQFSLEEAKRTFLEILAAADLHDTENVLFDGLALSGQLTVMERYAYGAFVAEAALGFARRHPRSATRFAYVLSEPVLDPARFGETVAVNRGVHLRTFDNVEDALAWLAQGTA